MKSLVARRRGAVRRARLGARTAGAAIFSADGVGCEPRSESDGAQMGAQLGRRRVPLGLVSWSW